MWLCQNIPPSASAPVSILQAIFLFNFEGTNQLRDDFATCFSTSFFSTRVHFAEIAKIPATFSSSFRNRPGGTGVDQNRGQITQMTPENQLKFK